MVSRDEIILDYLERLPYAPYPVQEEAMFAWASSDQGILLTAPTGTGKTLVAEAAVYEGLRTGTGVYYSTPLIALTDQKFLELQDTAARWGYERDAVGLVTGNRTVNPNAPIKVVVAEVLLNRLLHPETYDFSDVGAVVMDEFHNFNEAQRGIVWELALSLLPKHVRVMLLSATVGSAFEFVSWMATSLDRQVTLVEGKERKVPLHFHWIGDEILPDFLERIAKGTEDQRRTPALVFCFDREACWAVADVLRGKDLFADGGAGQRQALLDRLDSFDFAVGSGNKLRTFLARGIGVHHAGLLPRYRRVVERLFQEKLLPVCVCTETLAAGLNLPARSVVLTTLVKGPRDRKKLIDASSAQQMFGRAGRPQFDTEGHVFALAHEDDVKLARWKEKYDSISEDTKDPGLMKAKKALLKKKPTRRANFTYWNADQFTRLQVAPPVRLASKGNLTWRWLAFLLDANPAVEPIRQVIRRRLMEQPRIEAELKRLTRMLVTLDHLGVVKLDPPPPESWKQAVQPAGASMPAPPAPAESESDELDEADDSGDSAESTPSAKPPAKPTAGDLMARLKLGDVGPAAQSGAARGGAVAAKSGPPQPEPYEPVTATPTEKLKQLMVFRAVHPLYGLFLLDYLGKADDAELIQILESLLEMPGPVAKCVRVPWPDVLPPGPLSVQVIDPAILTGGLATQDDLYPQADQSDLPPELRKYPVPLGQKVRMLFESRVDHAGGLFITPVWAAGDLLNHGGDFDRFVRSRDLVKQEGILFKHLLRLILLCREFMELTPTGVTPADWQAKLAQISESLTQSCRAVDPQSTDEMLEEMAEGV